RFEGFEGNVKDAIGVLQSSVGPEGGIMVPTQPFTSTAVEWVRTHPVTDLARARSLMGLVTEVLRRPPGVVRSVTPTHPVAGWGRGGGGGGSVNPTHPVGVWGRGGLALVGNDWEASTPCGKGTAYHRLLEAGGKILFLGTSVQTMTFYHCVEEVIETLMPFSP